MNEKNVAIIIKNLTKGGAEKQSIVLAHSLTEDYNVHYIVFNGNQLDSSLLSFLQEKSNITICFLEGNHLKKINTLSTYLKENKIDALFSYLTAANFYATVAGKMAHVPKIYIGLRSAKLPFLKMLSDRFLTNNFSTLAIANSFKGKEVFVEKGFKENKIRVIANAYPDPLPYYERKKKDVIDIISVGRFVEAKDYLTALQAIAELRKKHENIVFHIVGYGHLEKNIREWIQELNLNDIVQIHINPSNIPELLKKSDIYLITSVFEGTSNAVMEAMDASLPVVATQVGDNNHLVSENINGYLLACKDISGIANKLSVLVADYTLRLNMGREGNRILTTKFSKEAFVESYKILLDD